MKKIIFITALVAFSLISYSQSYLVLEEDFTGNSIPAEWYVGNPGTGTQLWSFGSNHVPQIGGGTDFDFANNAAIFSDDDAGNGGQHDWTRLTYPITPGFLNLSSYTNSIVKLSYEYALNVSNTGSEALRVLIYDHANSLWRVIVEYNQDTTPTFDFVNLTEAFATYPGINQSDVLFCFEYDDIDSDWGWGAGIDNVKLTVEAVNQYCVDAIPITVAPYDNGCVNSITANNIGAMNSEASQGTPSCGGFNGGDIWYSFEAPNSGGVKIILPNGEQDWSSVSLAVYNDCSETTAISCENTKTEAIFEGLVPNNTYLLRLWDFNNNDFGEVDFCIEENNTPPTNDEAVNSILMSVAPLGSNCENTLMYNTFATDSSPINGTPVCGSYSGGDLWYHFTVPPSGAIKINRSQDGNWGHLSYAIYDVPSDTTEIVCGTIFTGENESITISGLVPGQMDGLRVWEWENNDFGTERICLEEVSTSGIADNIIDGFSMYPNPVNNVLNIKTTNTINQIHIYNLLGQEVLFISPNNTQTQINVSNLSKGSYILKVQAGKQLGAYQLIKE